MEEINVPLKIFKDRELCVLESLVVYLKEEKRLSNIVISKLLNRDSRTIWTSYNRAKVKRGGRA